MRGRRGVALVIVLTLVLLLALTLGAYFFLVSGETDRTAARSREIQATLIGEGVANRITMLINRWPWSDRLQLRLGTNGRLSFTDRTFPFGAGDPLTRQPDVTFAGVISDTGPPLCYRLKLSIVCGGQRVFMVWDKQHSTSLLSAAADDGTVLLNHPDGTAESAIDALVDQVKTTSRRNRPLGLVPADMANTVDAEILDRQSGKDPARTILGL